MFFFTMPYSYRMTVPFGYERVYLPVYKVADTPFHVKAINSFIFFLGDMMHCYDP